jgi:hypothetical protein
MVLTLLRALAVRPTVDWAAVTPSGIERMLELGLGPVLAHLADSADNRRGLPYVERIRAAALTAHALTSATYDSLAHALAAARQVQCPVILLKGAATALRYYPSPHLRPMGDIDLLVPADRQATFEDALRAFTFRQFPIDPMVNYDDHLHTAPFWDPERGVWIEVHTSVFPRDYRLAQDRRFSWAAINAQLTPITVRDQTAYVMNHELQLIYTSARWCEMFDPRHGVYPILDAALLIRQHGETLDWERMLALVRGSWAAVPLHLMLWYLNESELSAVPPDVLSTLGTTYRHLNQRSLRVLKRMISTCVLEGEFLQANERHLQLVWTCLVRPKSVKGYLRSIAHKLAARPVSGELEYGSAEHPRSGEPRHYRADSGGSRPSKSSA